MLDAQIHSRVPNHVAWFQYIVEELPLAQLGRISSAKSESFQLS